MLPVSVTATTCGASTSDATREDGTSSARKAAAGRPASRSSSSIASAQPVTFEACFSRPTLPAMSAGAAKRNTCQSGKFQGITASTGPSGSKAT